MLQADNLLIGALILLQLHTSTLWQFMEGQDKIREVSSLSHDRRPNIIVRRSSSVNCSNRIYVEFTSTYSSNRSRRKQFQASPATTLEITPTLISELLESLVQRILVYFAVAVKMDQSWFCCSFRNFSANCILAKIILLLFGYVMTGTYGDN